MIPLADVLAAELRRLGAPDGPGRHRHNGQVLAESPLPRLRTLGHELVTPLEAVLDNRDTVVVAATLDRACIIAFPDGERTVARTERLTVDPGAVSFRPVRHINAWGRQSVSERASAARGRAASAQAKRGSRKPPDGLIGTLEAARIANAATSVVSRACDRGELPVAQASPEGYRWLRPVDVAR